jgi:hypothetical protein
VQFAAVLFGEVEIAQHLGLAIVDKGGELWPFVPVGDRAQHRARLGSVGLQKRLPQGRRHHALLGLRETGESVAHPMNAAALPAGAEDAADRGFEPFISVGDDQLDPTQAAPRQIAQKRRPERLGLR